MYFAWWRLLHVPRKIPQTPPIFRAFSNEIHSQKAWNEYIESNLEVLICFDSLPSPWQWSCPWISPLNFGPSCAALLSSSHLNLIPIWLFLWIVLCHVSFSLPFICLLELILSFLSTCPNHIHTHLCMMFSNFLSSNFLTLLYNLDIHSV